MKAFRLGAGQASAALLGALVVLCGCRSKRALLPRGEGAAVVVVSGSDEAVAAGPASDPTDETEPNNSVNAAQTLKFPLSPDQAAVPLEVSLSGSLSPPTDVDVFRLALDPGMAPDPDAGQSPLRFALALQVVPSTEAPEAMRIEVLQGEVGLIRTNVQAEPLRVPNLPLAPQSDLIVRVARVKPKGELPLSYVLRAQARPLAAGEESEPNGAVAQASPMVAPTATAEMAGHLGWRQDTDWFAVGFPSGLKESSLSLDLQLPEGGIAEVSFADAQGGLQHGHTRASGGVLSLRHVRPPAEGNVAFVRVHNAGPAVFERRYRLSVMAMPLDPGVEQEPNGSFAQAQGIEGARVRGHIHPAGDEDTYKVCDPQGGLWQIRPPEKLALAVSVIDASGRMIFQQPFETTDNLLVPPASGAACNFIQIREKSHKRSNLLDYYELKRIR